MRRALLACAIALTMSACAAASARGDAPTAAAAGRTALVIHGGAGVIERGKLDRQTEAAIRADLGRALDAGNAVLARGGPALDAVQAAIAVLEDSPRFNAGKGAVFTADGTHTLDASVMEGHSGRAGAVAGVTTVRHPLQLARAVMEHSPHVMLAGAGAEQFADARREIERVPNSWFDTPERKRALEKAQAEERKSAASGQPLPAAAYFGTVGAVALDRSGHIAAGTSTGGMTNKKWGRVGDSPIIGAGTWADARCGVSATGWGEFFIRHVVAYDICARMAYRGDSLKAASDAVIMDVIPRSGGDGGVIAIDAQGNIAMPFNTEGMYRASIGTDGRRTVAIYGDER